MGLEFGETEFALKGGELANDRAPFLLLVQTVFFAVRYIGLGIFKALRNYRTSESDLLLTVVVTATCFLFVKSCYSRFLSK